MNYFHYKSHLLRPKSHKRCPSIKLWFENIWNIYFVKIFKTSHPNLLILNGDKQLPTHKHDQVKKSACEEIISILLYFLQNGIHTSEYNLHSIQYLIYHLDYLFPTSQPLDQHPTNQPDKLPQPTLVSWPPYHPKYTDQWPTCRPWEKHNSDNHENPNHSNTMIALSWPRPTEQQSHPNHLTILTTQTIPVAQSHYMISRYIGGKRCNRS